MMSEQTQCGAQEAEICPVCGCKDLDYGDSGIQDESYIYDWTCPQCGSAGQECHTLVFDEHIVTSQGDV